MAGITNESQIIDYNGINECCEKIKEAAFDFKEVGKTVNEVGNLCTTKVLSVDGLSMQPGLYELGAGISKIKEDVDSFADNIKSLAKQVQTKQKEELKKYEKEQAKKN